MEPDEIQLVSFYIGQRRYDDAERMMKVLLEKQSEILQNGGKDDVAMGYTLRALGGFEEARGRIPLARAHRENSMNVFAAALGPTHKETLYSVELFAETLKRQGYWYEAVEFYNSIKMQFQDSKISDRQKLAIEMALKCDSTCSDQEITEMAKEDVLSRELREKLKPKMSRRHSLRHVMSFSEEKKLDDDDALIVEQKFMHAMLTSDEYHDMVGAKDLRKTCKLAGCFNLFRFYLSVMEYNGMRPGEAGFSHCCRRIYRDFVLEPDILEFIDNETRVYLGEILEVRVYGVSTCQLCHGF